MWLPDWLYRALPFIYTLFGFLCLFAGSWMGYLGGCMLLVAALIIWKLRQVHRELRNGERPKPE